LSHQTGFPNWRNGKLEFEFEPGIQWQYSGEGFEYLRKALENKFGESLVELSDSLLFGPLGMKDTRYFWDEDMDESRFACWHDAKGICINRQILRVVESMRRPLCFRLSGIYASSVLI